MSEFLGSLLAHDRCANLQLEIGCCFYTSSWGRIPSTWSLPLVSSVPQHTWFTFLSPGFCLLIPAPHQKSSSSSRSVPADRSDDRPIAISADSRCPLALGPGHPRQFCLVPGLLRWEASGTDGPLSAEVLASFKVVHTTRVRVRVYVCVAHSRCTWNPRG